MPLGCWECFYQHFQHLSISKMKKGLIKTSTGYDVIVQIDNINMVIGEIKIQDIDKSKRFQLWDMSMESDNVIEEVECGYLPQGFNRLRNAVERMLYS